MNLRNRPSYPLPMNAQTRMNLRLINVVQDDQYPDPFDSPFFPTGVVSPRLACYLGNEREPKLPSDVCHHMEELHLSARGPRTSAVVNAIHLEVRVKSESRWRWVTQWVVYP